MRLQKTFTSKKGYKGGRGKTVYMQIGIWRQGRKIHITAPEEDFIHTTVTDKKSSIRYHSSLYNMLKKLLGKYGCWE